jgi:proteasome activator subunit 4
MLQCVDIVIPLTTPQWQPKPSVPTVEVFLRECQTLPEADIMSIRTVSQTSRFDDLLRNFTVWRGQRHPGARAIHSTYDRAASTVLRWLILALHDIQAVSVYDYVLPFIVSSGDEDGLIKH